MATGIDFVVVWGSYFSEYHFTVQHLPLTVDSIHLLRRVDSSSGFLPWGIKTQKWISDSPVKWYNQQFSHPQIVNAFIFNLYYMFRHSPRMPKHVVEVK
jgi:hypothetical protein